VLVAAGLLTSGWLLATRPPAGPAAASRQAAVAARGRAVMGFDLDRTTHLFQALADGGGRRSPPMTPATTSRCG
jgi:hypothetical protein